MYQPAHHREDRTEAQHQLIISAPLGLLISSGPTAVLANALPFLLQPRQGQLGTLQAHMARANGQWRDLDGQPVLVVFQGTQNYVSPSHYQTKRETGKVVPTWNYVMVQARGVARLQEDPAWLDAQIDALTRRHESDRAKPWQVSDAPRPYVESQLRGIVGVEIEIQNLDGKWKVSQNRTEADRRGVADGLAAEAPAMADIIRDYGGV